MERTILAALLASAALSAGALAAEPEGKTPNPAKPALARLQPGDLERWGRPQMVFTGKLEKVVAGPVGMSDPPVYSFTLHLTVKEALRGEIEPGRRLALAHTVRQRRPPRFAEGKLCLAGASRVRGRLRLDAIDLATPEKLARARLACSIPIGWSVQKGKPVCPWAETGAKAWPSGAKAAGAPACSKTGRPALLVGKEVKFEVAPEPPVRKIRWTNPDGDGVYKITLTNPTDKPVEVPALLTDGKEILWKECLLILCQGKVYTVPGCKGVAGKPGPVRLAPGQIAAGTVNALALQGPKWPRGGYRIEFQFCLGERSIRRSFYYLSRHHDGLRQKALEQAGRGR